MKRETKKEVRERREAWARAVDEGRVIRFSWGAFRSFPSIEARDEFLADLEPGIAVAVAPKAGEAKP